MKQVLETKEVSGSPNWLTTRFEALVKWALQVTHAAEAVNWSRANSLWPMPFGTACCAIEFMATAASRFDFARFGMERQAFSPRQADVLICAGRLPFKLAPVIRRIYDQMPQPKWVISMGACASTGGIFDNYAMVQGIDTIVPVDVYVPGCPPRPEGLLYGVLLLHKKIKGESLLDPSLRQEQPLDERGLRLPPEQIDEISEPFGNSIHQFRSA
jgi:NADH-quinone oxidoreductase subunit B